MNILGHLKNHTTNFSVPKVENAKLFIPYANPDKIELNSEKKSVKILSQNISVDITFFKEALFMKLLQAKLPKENSRRDDLRRESKRNCIRPQQKRRARVKLRYESPPFQGRPSNNGKSG